MLALLESERGKRIIGYHSPISLFPDLVAYIQNQRPRTEIAQVFLILLWDNWCLASVRDIVYVASQHFSKVGFAFDLVVQAIVPHLAHHLELDAHHRARERRHRLYCRESST